MLKYIFKRVLIFIPTLLAISLLTFVISVNAPGDPVESMLNKGGSGEGQLSAKIGTERAYNELRKQLGLDLPVFYFSFTNATVSDTLYRVSKINHRATLDRLSFNNGNWPAVANYYNSIRRFENSIYSIEKTEANSNALRRLKENVNSLYDAYEEEKIQSILANVNQAFNENNSFKLIRNEYNATKSAFESMVQSADPVKKYIPSFHFYGTNNQYHRWIFGDAPWFSDEVKYGETKGFFRGDFGISYQDKRPVKSVIWDAVRWTMLISILSMILAYLFAIPLGVTSAVSKGTKKERSLTTMLFILYSLPNFWIATMLIMFFGGGDFYDVFPAFGLGTLPDSAPFMERFSETAYHLVLPLICWTYGSLAFISRQMRGGMLNVIGQDYIRTARAKGLNEKAVIWKHALRNSLIPIITLFASIFPLAISGSFVIEFIFSIPGMGKISLDALVARNYPIIFTVMMFTAILTLIGNLVADILYAVVDPRISFSNKSK